MSKLLGEAYPFYRQKLLQLTNFLKIGHTPKYGAEMCQKETNLHLALSAASRCMKTAPLVVKLLAGKRMPIGMHKQK